MGAVRLTLTMKRQEASTRDLHRFMNKLIQLKQVIQVVKRRLMSTNKFNKLLKSLENKMEAMHLETT